MKSKTNLKDQLFYNQYSEFKTSLEYIGDKFRSGNIDIFIHKLPN